MLEPANPQMSQIDADREKASVSVTGLGSTQHLSEEDYYA